MVKKRDCGRKKGASANFLTGSCRNLGMEGGMMIGIDDEEVMIYMMNELVETEKMVNIFKVMMEYEDYPFDFLFDQFMILLNRVDSYAMTTRSEEFFEAVQKLNFRKVDAITGETAELDDADPDSLDDYSPWDR